MCRKPEIGYKCYMGGRAMKGSQLGLVGKKLEHRWHDNHIQNKHVLMGNKSVALRVLNCSVICSRGMWNSGMEWTVQWQVWARDVEIRSGKPRVGLRVEDWIFCGITLCHWVSGFWWSHDSKIVVPSFHHKSRNKLGLINLEIWRYYYPLKPWEWYAH